MSGHPHPHPHPDRDRDHAARAGFAVWLLVCRTAALALLAPGARALGLPW